MIFGTDNVVKTGFVRGVPSLECFDYSSRVIVLFGVSSRNLGIYTLAMTCPSAKKNGDMPVSEIHKPIRRDYNSLLEKQRLAVSLARFSIQAHVEETCSICFESTIWLHCK